MALQGQCYTDARQLAKDIAANHGTFQIYINIAGQGPYAILFDPAGEYVVTHDVSFEQESLGPGNPQICFFTVYRCNGITEPRKAALIKGDGSGGMPLGDFVKVAAAVGAKYADRDFLIPG